MNHAALVQVARKWLKAYKRCPIVICDLVTAAGEIPDAIGWTRGGVTHLVECKASRADFKVDAAKFWRREPREGMGEFRFFLTIPNLIKVDELPLGWGLLEVNARGVVVVRPSHAAACECKYGHCDTAFPVRATRREFAMLASLIRRMAGPGVRGKATVDIDPYTNDEHGQPINLADSGSSPNSPSAPLPPHAAS